MIAGENVTVSGTGSAANPYKVSAQVPCDTVRGCFTAGPGIDLDTATGVISADLSGQAGNNLLINPDGGLYVPTSGGSVVTGCGLTGDGSASAPVEAAVGTWPYPCGLDEAGGVVVCDSDGVLRSEPRGKVVFTRFSENRGYPDTKIDSGSVAVVDTFSTTVTNPSTCLPALAVVEQEVDIYMVLPAGGAGAVGIGGDETFYVKNTGSSAMSGVHSQATKVLSGGTLAPGASLSVSVGASVGRGAGGAYYYQINTLIRVLLIAV
ncbi:hypothetical protein ACWEQC_22250 [Streptomyces shenzhenensis]